MKAWQFTNANEPPVFNEVPEPTTGPGEVVLEMKAAGLCHSDVGLLHDEGWLALLAKRPITIGHENASVVAQICEGVTDFAVGDHVGVCATAEGEGAPGYAFDGGFAPKMTVPAACLVPFPDGVDFINGAVATDAGMTSYHAMVTRGGVEEGMKVGVIGLGGLGRLGARADVLLGAEVYVAEINERSGTRPRKSAPSRSPRTSRTLPTRALTLSSTTPGSAPRRRTLWTSSTLAAPWSWSAWAS